MPEFSHDGEPSQEVAGDQAESKSSLEEWDWDSFLKDRLMPPPMGEYEEREAFPFESLNAEKTTLKSHLTWQLQMAELDEEAEGIATLIIGNLDLDGYLRATTEEIAAELGVDPARVEEVLVVVQGFDPPGVAARSLLNLTISAPPTATAVIGNQLPFTATAVYADASQDVTADATWTIDNPNVAVLADSQNQPGLITAVDGGTTTVRVSFGGKTQTMTLTVK